jgi:hypothetical protein
MDHDQICVRINRDLRQALEQTARAEHRTLSGQLRKIVVEALKNSRAAGRPQAHQEAAQ